jgi:hypothetical protein
VEYIELEHRKVVGCIDTGLSNLQEIKSGKCYDERLGTETAKKLEDWRCNERANTGDLGCQRMN